MRTTRLGRTGPEIGIVGLGCMGMTFSYDMAVPRDERTLVAVIRKAIDLGATLIDTADAYGPGTNEELVGKALSGAYREHAVVATKVGLVTAGGGTSCDGRPEHIRRAVDGSLRRLRTDRVDLYQLHRVDPKVPVEESWAAMAELVAAGKVRYLGLSKATVDEVRRAHAIHPMAALQYELSLWAHRPLTEVLPLSAASSITFLASSPLGRGYFTGRFTKFADLPEADYRRTLPRFRTAALSSYLPLVTRVRKLAERIEATPAQVALAWVMAQGPNVVPIPGTKNPEYLLDNVAATDIVLSPTQMAELSGS